PPPRPPLFPYTTLFRSEHLLEVAAAVDRRLHAEQGVDDFGHLLLEGRAHVLHHGGFEVRILARLEHEGDRERHLPQGRQVRDERSEEHTSELQSLAYLV